MDAPRKRRGRPPGSVSLTNVMEETIVAFVRSGAMVGTAARAAGVPERTFYEWMARGRGDHPTRPQTPKLKAFARRVDQAQAEARLAAEIDVYRSDRKWWLSHAARSKPGSEGWTKPVEEDAQQEPSTAFVELLRRVDHEQAIEQRDEHRATCAGCPSPLHERRYDDDRNCIQPLGPRRDSD